MTQVREVYRCNTCGIMVEVLKSGVGTLVCCGNPMEKLVENTIDASKEKHVPVIEDNPNGGCKVKVGSVAHPMEEKHYIEWIEFEKNGKVIRQHLKPGDLPEANFCGNKEGAKAREYCNIHGLWSS